MKTTIFAEKSFTARHAVQLDPRFTEPHEREWRLRVGVTGPITEPGWIMPFEGLVEILDLAIPRSGNLNELAENATSEALAVAFWGIVESHIPDPSMDLVRLELTEAPNRTVVLEREANAPATMADRLAALEDRVDDLEYRAKDVP